MKLSVLFLGLTISIGSMASDARQDIAKRYIGMAHAYDVRVRKEAAMHGVAQRYVRFLEQFGAADSGDIKETMEALFAADCRKVINGKVVVRSSEELYTQMANAKEVVGNWSLKIVSPVMLNIDTNTIVIHYHISPANFGTVVVMKFLQVDNGFITEINEVYNMLDIVDESFTK